MANMILKLTEKIERENRTKQKSILEPLVISNTSDFPET